MPQEQLQTAMQQIEKRLEMLKRENPAEYERMLKELASALEEFNRDLHSIV